MSEGYYMLFIKGVPKSTQIKWLVKKYSNSYWKQKDLKHVNDRISFIDGFKEYAGVYIRDGDEYHYIFIRHDLDAFKNYTEVFYCADDISIGEL